MLAHVVGGVDEAAEHDGVEPVLQQLLHPDHRVPQLVVLAAFQRFGFFSQVAQGAPQALVGLLGVRAGHNIGDLGLLAFEIEDHPAPFGVHLGRALTTGSLRAVVEGGDCCGRAGGDGSEQGQGRPPADALAALVHALVQHDLSAVRQDVVDELLVVAVQLVGLLALPPVGKDRDGVEVRLQVGATTLDEVASQALAVLAVVVAAQVLGGPLQDRVE